MRRLIKRFAVGGAAVAAASGAMVATGATPSYALATCPSGHICFYHDYSYLGNGNYTAAGTMSDQTNALQGHPSVQQVEWTNKKIPASVNGKIGNFKNSHYTNGQGLNDSVSLVVNNSGDCLAVWPDANFESINGIAQTGNFGVEFAPHTSKAMAGATLGLLNDRLSSAVTIPGNTAACLQASSKSNHYMTLG
jgi:hypothetical protein